MIRTVHTIDAAETACLAGLTDAEGIAYAAIAYCSIGKQLVEADRFYLKTGKGTTIQIGTRWIDLPRGERVAALSISSAANPNEMSAFEFSAAWIKSLRIVSAAGRGDTSRIDAAIEVTSHTNDRTYFQIADLHNQEDAVLLVTDTLLLNRSEVRDLALQ